MMRRACGLAEGFYYKEHVMKVWILAAVLTCGLAAPSLMPARAADTPGAKPAEAGEVETKVKLADCPKAVQDTINKAAQGGTVGDVEKETENGKTTYEADVTINGKKFEVKVAEDGTLLKTKAEDNDKDGDDDAGEHEDKN